MLAKPATLKAFDFFDQPYLNCEQLKRFLFVRRKVKEATAALFVRCKVKQPTAAAAAATEGSSTAPAAQEAADNGGPAAEVQPDAPLAAAAAVEAAEAAITVPPRPSLKLCQDLYAATDRARTVIVPKPGTLHLLAIMEQQEYTTFEHYSNYSEAVKKKEGQRKRTAVKAKLAVAAAPHPKVIKTTAEHTMADSGSNDAAAPTNRSTELLKELATCPVCWDLPEVGKPVYGCVRGHHWCQTCHQGGIVNTRCPVCRTPADNAIRVLSIEKIVETLLPPVHPNCDYCEMPFLCREMGEHMKLCYLRPIPCPRRGCNFVGDVGALNRHWEETSDISEHIDEGLSGNGLPKFSGYLTMKPEKTPHQGLLAHWKPFILAFRGHAYGLIIHGLVTALEDQTIRFHFKTTVDYDMEGLQVLLTIKEMGNDCIQRISPLKVHRSGINPWELTHMGDAMYISRHEYQSWSKQAFAPDNIFKWEAVLKVSTKTKEKLEHLRTIKWVEG